MSTPHNQAEIGQIAKTVLMPGDPLRAKFIAETFLENPVQFNSVRNMFGYTGTFEGKLVSVMGSGMGVPSIGIYSYELFKFFGVENIIRIGTTGSYNGEELGLFDVLKVTGSYSDSTYALMQSGDSEKIQKPSEAINAKIDEASKELNIPVKEGYVNSSDVFYYEDSQLAKSIETVKKYNLKAAEMESFALFHNAKVLGKNAACLLTVSDVIGSGEETTAEERQKSFTNMMKVALRVATKL